MSAKSLLCLFGPMADRCPIAVMAMISAFLSLASSGVVAGDPPKPALSFSLTATDGNFVRTVGPGLRLCVDRDELGWEVGVYRRRGSDNLLLPAGNWHGAQACQIYTWMPRLGTFGNSG
jgi:hypothetical protein